jgi:hypothetical protein
MIQKMGAAQFTKVGSAQESEQVIDWRGFANGEVFRTL